MVAKFIEVTNGLRNWGKFLLLRFDCEWQQQSVISGRPLLRDIGFNPQQVWVLDLQTCEGAAFMPGGHVGSDLDKHAIWICPMYQPFLEWLYRQDVTNLEALPSHVDLPEAEFQMSGYRRPGNARADNA